MNTGYFHRVAAQTATRFWINNVTRKEAAMAIEAGAVGCTQNPSYVWKMLNHPDEQEHALAILDKHIAQTQSDDEALIRTQRELVSEVAKVFLPLYEASGGQMGYVSIQGNPFEESHEKIVEQGLFNREGGANIMVKVPVIEAGLKAIRTLLENGAPINATEVFAVRQALDVAELYQEFSAVSRTAPVVYFSHITGIYDEYLGKQAAREGIDISPDTLWQAGIIVAKKAYHLTKRACPAVGFIGGGARGLHYFTEMVGANACITINWQGTADKLLETNPPVVDRFHAPVDEAVLDELLTKMPDFRRGYMLNGITPPEYEGFGPVELFRDSFTSAWENARKLAKERRAKQ